ncbi:MAG: flagellar basal body P-ring protein FlgI, partial [Pseudomonadota bacterium]
GVNTRGENLNTENVAAVMVTANLHPFATQGSRIDVNVSALGDAESLLGGTLLATPLIAADGEIYAVSQGPIAVGGFSAGGDAATVTRGVPTSGRIANGAIIEREIEFNLAQMQSVRLSLRNPDFTTANRIAAAINAFLGGDAATVTDPTNVRLKPPPGYAHSMVGLLTEVEQLMVEPDQPARVIIDEASGIIVMGSDVRVSTVAIAQGNLTITVSEAPQVSQPNAFAENGETVVVPRTDVEVDDGAGDPGAQFAIVEESVRLQDLVDGLNALGVGPRDMISILQSIKAAGALQADIELM